jgi:Telomeric single stranded DNA binding POT1/CDC13
MQSSISSSKVEPQGSHTIGDKDGAEESHVSQKSQRRAREPARKSDIPGIISPWFAPSRRSSQLLKSPSPTRENMDNQEDQTLRNDTFIGAQGSQTMQSDHKLRGTQVEDRQEIYHESAIVSTQREESVLRRIKNNIPTTSQPTQLPSTTASQTPELNRQKRDPLNSNLLFTYALSQTQPSQPKGLLTALSYYTPLSHLYNHLNIPSSQAFHDTGLDVLAVVSKPTTIPKRAELGQRDYHVAFSLTDEAFWPSSVRVQIFRPWKDALPKAVKGDVILLRGFEVFSAKGNIGAGLKAGASGAWCVWRFNGVEDEDAGKEKPIWAKKNGADLSLEDREEANGPPVEIGDEEREYVLTLRQWWGERMVDASSEGS